jgi:hypothetical protein
MSNGTSELTLYKPEQFAALNPDGDLAEAIACNMDGVELRPHELLQIRIPTSGTKTFVWEDVGEEMSAKTITGIPIHIHPVGNLWPYESISDGNRPVLVSVDLERGWINPLCEDHGDIDLSLAENCKNEDGSYSWVDLPWNEWGTKTAGSGKGKRCQRTGNLYLLRESDAWPICIKLSTTSMLQWSAFAAGLTRKFGLVYYRMIVEVSLKTEDGPAGPYSIACFRPIGSIDKQSGAKLVELYKKPIQKAEMDTSRFQKWTETEDGPSDGEGDDRAKEDAGRPEEGEEELAF